MEGLKTWITGKDNLSFDEDKEYSEEVLENMKFISKDFLVSLHEHNSDLFEKFWQEDFMPAEGYKFMQDWSNNYAVIKVESADGT